MKEIHQISSNLAITAFNQISSDSYLRPEPSLSLIFQISSNSAIMAFNQISSNSDLHLGAFITSDYAGGLKNDSGPVNFDTSILEFGLDFHI
jgi:hypothetical protein